MSPYYVFWSAGCAIGAFVADVVARPAGVSRTRMTCVLAPAVCAFTWGAALQFRLEEYPLREAVLFTPLAVFSGGHRIPLGLLTGGFTAAAFARLLRVPWRRMADGLALGAWIGITIGRIGCMLNGCCTGTICPPQLRFLCVRYGPGTEPYGLQLAAGVIHRGAPLSEPVHPLPLYFLAVAAVMAVVSALLLRRRATPGAIGAAFAVVYPASHLLLEHIRGRTGGAVHGVNLAVPALAFLGASLWLAVLRPRRTDCAPYERVPLTTGMSDGRVP